MRATEVTRNFNISIHALREEGDVHSGGYGHTGKQFLSTPSARRATLTLDDEPEDRGISIHALREEGDIFNERRQPHIGHFYPRPPRGGRPGAVKQQGQGERFLSTPSARRATRGGSQGDRGRGISIHALREEGDKQHHAESARTPTFLSTPSARRATVTSFPSKSDSSYFYPRPPRGGRRHCCGGTGTA